MEFSTLREKISHENKARASRYADFQEIVDKAHKSGLKAGVDCRPVPMHVIDQYRGQEWRIDDGACGFAWVTVKPANSSFAIWAKKTGLMRSAYGGGVQLWVSEFGQSVDRKAAYAGAYAEILREHGIKAYAGDRLD